MIALLTIFALDFAPVAGGPNNLVAADVNRDGRADLIVTTKDEVVTVLNLAAGWKEGTRLKPPRPASDLVTADFNRDGNPDAAITDHDTFAVTVMFGDGKGGWLSSTMVRAKPTGAPHVHGLCAGDLNGDKVPDLLFASSGEGEVVALLNDGKGGFTPGKPVKAAKNAWHPALGDFNEDGRLDVVTATFEGQGMAVLLGDGQGGFSAAPGSPHQTFPRSFLVKTADVNRDGHADVYGVHDDHGRVTLLLGDGKGGFTQAKGSPFDIGTEAYGVQAVDVDRDGSLDLAVGTLQREVRVFRQVAGRFQGPDVWSREGGGFRLIGHDFDGDGRPELALADSDRQRVTFYR